MVGVFLDFKKPLTRLIMIVYLKIYAYGIRGNIIIFMIG